MSGTAREDRARNLVRAFGLLITASEVIVCDYSKAIRMLRVDCSRYAAVTALSLPQRGSLQLRGSEGDARLRAAAPANSAAAPPGRLP